ncbi:MAG: HhH-GPD-type base excision DNA repair protein [Rhodothermales bacterium]
MSIAADYSELDGGLVRMLDRLQQEGTATKDPDADQFLRDDANAVVLGLLFDQRVLAETAFCGPLKLKQRLGHFEMRRIADHDADAFKEVFAQSPAVHRFTNTMADRTQAVARLLADEYDGDAANLWADGADLATVEKRLRKLPGFGPLKAKKLKFCLYYFQDLDLSARG